MDNIKPLNIRCLFSQDKYLIPIYQRNYAWGEREISQLIQDIYDFATKENQSTYYIGTLVVHERKNHEENIFETIDGQQRLTTLNILLSVIKRLFNDRLDINEWFELNLEFESRKTSTDTLEEIFDKTDEVHYEEFKTYNPAIQQAYREAEKALKKIVITNNKIKDFYEFLKDQVVILRVGVPPETDLNHYFEIMNNRGEQLEKHEVLKAKMLEVIKGDKNLTYTFNLIWEACSDMERYVQYGFSVDERDEVFKMQDWNTLEINDLQMLSDRLFSINNQKTKPDELGLSITSILAHKESFKVQKNKKEDAPERFSTVINFSNFLLHVLRIQMNSNGNDQKEKDISLDDKKLLEAFDFYLKPTDNEENKIAFVKDFGFNLLKCKFLFDKFILKREFLKDKDQWSLKRLKWYNKKSVSYINTFGAEDDLESENKDILMILSMFHVSTPTLVYKHWLNAALMYVFNNPETNSKEYLAYLENLAKSFLFDRFLAKKPEDYFEIIYKNQGYSKNKEIESSRLDQGTNVENFIFNYLDYLLWKKKEGGIDKFEFTFRSSVEHYYPRNPVGNIDKINEKSSNDFGNLCLISASKNSQLSNNLPKAKKDYYVKVGADSLKQKLMMQEENWGIVEIENHGKAMKQILIEDNFKL